MKLGDINSDHMRSWLQAHSNHPTQTALAARQFCAFLNWCERNSIYRGIVPRNTCPSNLYREILPRRRAKTDCLQREQLAAWFAAVKNIINPVIAAYLQMLLLVGARREELARLQWTDVDFRWLTISIHDKVDGMRTLPLTPYVAALINALPRRNNWIFSSPAAASGRLQEPRLQHNRACRIAGIDALTLHGLRRSFSTLSEWVETPVGVVAQIMGHKPSATAERHYKVRPLDLLRMWHTKIEAWILHEASVTFTPQQHGLRVVGGAAHT
jgi:integrase